MPKYREMKHGNHLMIYMLISYIYFLSIIRINEWLHVPGARNLLMVNKRADGDLKNLMTV